MCIGPVFTRRGASGSVSASRIYCRIAVISPIQPFSLFMYVALLFTTEFGMIPTVGWDSNTRYVWYGILSYAGHIEQLATANSSTLLSSLYSLPTISASIERLAEFAEALDGSAGSNTIAGINRFFKSSDSSCGSRRRRRLSDQESCVALSHKVCICY